MPSIEKKKVLLCERKRHTARRVLSTPSVVLPGYPPVLTWLVGGSLPGYPPGRVPPWPGQYLTRVPPSMVPPRQGTPPDLAGGGTLVGGTLVGYPLWQGTPSGRVPPQQGTPSTVPPLAGYPLLTWLEGGTLIGYPPLAGYPPAQYPPGRVPPRLDLAGYPPPPVSVPWNSG